MYLAKSDLHLAYCTNIHPAESWDETFHALNTHTLEVRRRLHEHGVLATDTPYAIGLRLSARAARDLLDGQLDAFRQWLDKHHCYVFTINGFPYGNFHGTRVKEQVYQPDWSDPARLDYTRDLFSILAQLAPAGTQASVSTLPGSFKAFAADPERLIHPLRLLACELDSLSESHEVDFHLGLEPEPLGHFENTAETLRFFDRLLDHTPDAECIHRRLGVNYDTCHFAIEFEDPVGSIRAFHNENIRISKIHASSALGLDPKNPAALDAIRAFDEPTYLHQVIARQADGRLDHFADLPSAFEPAHLARIAEADEWRVHFHIPLFAEPVAPLHSTKGYLEEICRLARQGEIPCQHWEFETYTWQVLPPELQRPVVEQLCEEYHWLLARL